MSNQIYGKGREAFGNAGINWVSDTVRIQLVDAGLYTVSIDVHDFFNDVPSGARVGAPTALASKTNVLGVFDADDPTISTSGSAGSTFEAAIIYKWTGVDSTSQLIAYMDSATGLPGTASGGDVLLVFDNGANKIFKL